MFTGIVEEVGEVVAVRRTDEVLELTVRGPTVSSDARHGDSIAVSGVCLTVTAVEAEVDPTADGPGGTFRVELVPETLARTSLAGVRAGTRVNLERAVAVGGRLGGHIVQGHVDGVGTPAAAATPVCAATSFVSACPPTSARYVVEKGSITVDGVSLTVAGTRRRDVLGGADPDDPDAHHTRFARRWGYRQPRGGRGREVRRAAHGRVRARR